MQPSKFKLCIGYLQYLTFTSKLLQLHLTVMPYIDIVKIHKKVVKNAFYVSWEVRSVYIILKCHVNNLLILDSIVRPYWNMTKLTMIIFWYPQVAPLHLLGRNHPLLKEAERIPFKKLPDFESVRSTQLEDLEDLFSIYYSEAAGH